ncbi:AraC family transcriptional regulator [Shewanella sp. AS16]|uniref:AraC family transcriptional regulator n=1 Tax=Shewanella sp. AS16 TaxID=2907625 RepID=UPI001F47416A|nr:AraC family transcriptional regulator [Shewanella sp. AS16]MCE9687340.1 AraC family transcriptional regulator [Shewanella sp. AS16]
MDKPVNLAECDDKDMLDSLCMQMATAIERWTVGKEDSSTAIPSLELFRRESPTQPSNCKIEPSLVIVVQGAKQLLVGNRSYAYDTSHFLINSLDIPGNSQALEASTDKPCLGLVFKLDLRIIAELIAEGSLPPPRERAPDGSSTLGTITPALLEPCNRLLALLDEPDTISVLAPLIEREIHFRLLRTDQAARLWQIASVGSMSHRVARAIDWLRVNYARPLRIEELATYVQMSTSNLHLHFRQLTSMSPLQYQKWLRLHEARSLMLNDRLDAGTAAFQVGYESASQFSREYSRLFGVPPKRDIEELRRQSTLLQS